MKIDNPLLHKIYMAELKDYLPRFDPNRFFNFKEDRIADFKQSLIARINDEQSDDIDVHLFDWSGSIIHRQFWFEVEIMLKLTHESFYDFWARCQTVDDFMDSFKTHVDKSNASFLPYLPSDFLEVVETNLRKFE